MIGYKVDTNREHQGDDIQWILIQLSIEIDDIFTQRMFILWLKPNMIRGLDHILYRYRDSESMSISGEDNHHQNNIAIHVHDEWENPQWNNKRYVGVRGQL